MSGDLLAAEELDDAAVPALTELADELTELTDELATATVVVDEELVAAPASAVLFASQPVNAALLNMTQSEPTPAQALNSLAKILITIRSTLQQLGCHTSSSYVEAIDRLNLPPGVGI